MVALLWPCGDHAHLLMKLGPVRAGVHTQNCQWLVQEEKKPKDPVDVELEKYSIITYNPWAPDVP